MILFKSMWALQKEKLVVVKKELLHLWHIADFYRMEESKSNDEKKTNDEGDGIQRGVIAQKIYTDIGNYFQCIEKLSNEIDEYYENYGKRNDEYISFLTLHDHYNNKISELLKTVRLIQSKLLQFQQEHYNQYMPVPNISKRYSSKGFLDYLKHYHTSILEREMSSLPDSNGNNSIHPITLWGYTDSFRAHETDQLLKDSQCKSDERYLEIPFWNYEIPFMLPIITHEMGHIVLDAFDNHYFQNFKKALINTEIPDNPFIENATFADEVLSDLLALMYHGNSYIIALAHELLGKQFSSQFYSNIPDDPIAINRFEEDPRFTESLSRLYIIAELHGELTKENEESDGNASEDDIDLSGLRKVLDWLIHPSDPDRNENSLRKIYDKNYGLDKEYHEDFYIHIERYKRIFFGALKSKQGDDLIEKLQAQFSWTRISEKSTETEGAAPLREIKKYRTVFKKLMSERLENLNPEHNEKISLKHRFRFLVLEQDGVIENGRGDAYELTLYKTRLDCFDEHSQPEDNYIHKLTNEIRKNDLATHKGGINPCFAFDYYSMIALNKKKETLRMKEIDRFLEYKNFGKEVKYYVNKHALLLIKKEKEKKEERATDEKTTNKQEENKKGNFGAFINLGLKQNNSEQTKAAKRKITTICTELDLKSYQIFKSLGPKEIIFHITDTNLKKIFEIKEKLFSGESEVFRRSHTIIYNKQNGSEDSIKSPYAIGSYVRAKIKSTEADFSNPKIQTKLLTTGVQDYTLRWKENTTLTDIIGFYDTLSGNSKNAKCTDAQTFLVKIIESEQNQTNNS